MVHHRHGPRLLRPGHSQSGRWPMLIDFDLEAFMLGPPVSYSPSRPTAGLRLAGHGCIQAVDKKGFLETSTLEYEMDRACGLFFLFFVGLVDATLVYPNIVARRFPLIQDCGNHLKQYWPCILWFTQALRKAPVRLT